MPNSNSTFENEKPLYLGHRVRLRQRFSADDGESMPDYELLELLLMMAIPRRDVKPLAKKLIAKFGSLDGTISASFGELLCVDGVSKNTAAIIKLANVCKTRSGAWSFHSRDENCLRFWPDFINICRQKVYGTDKNELTVLFFDDKITLIDVIRLNRKNITNEERENIVRKIVEIDATQAVLLSNNDSISHAEQNAEKKMIERAHEFFKSVDVRILDYIMFADREYVSFARKGLLPSAIADELKMKSLL